MKNIAVWSSVILVAVIICFGLFAKPVKEEYIRIHVRANSNEIVDQNIKYEIKDNVVSYLTPFIADCVSKSDFVKIISANLNNIEKIADEILNRNGFNYVSHASFKVEEFPTRSYDGTVLESGFYDALILELGEAEGDNWWCVVYPPLCFINNNSENILYKSKILEIIKSIISK